MKEKLYTIPLNDAFDANTECPFCYIERKIEQDLLDFVLGSGSSYMESDIREITDQKGQVEFYKKFPRMANIGSVTFSLDIATEALPSEALKKEIEETTITFDYNIKSEVSKEGIVIAFSEWDENGEQLPTTYSSDAFRSYLEKDGIKVVNADVITGGMMLVQFNTGEKRLFDPLKLEGEVFEPLKDENILKNFELFHGIITWNNGEIDIAPETVYYESYAYDSVIKKCL